MHLPPSGISITLPQTKNIALNPHKIDTKNTYQRTSETCVCKLNVRAQYKKIQNSEKESAHDDVELELPLVILLQQ